MTDNTPLDADDEIKQHCASLGVPSLWYERLIEIVTADRKKRELQARIDELGHCCGKCGVWHSETCNISQRRLTFRERIAELKAQQEEL